MDEPGWRVGLSFIGASISSLGFLAFPASAYRGNWGGETFEVYFSDDNNWADLSPMVGGTWDALETNPTWNTLLSDRGWSPPNGSFTPSLTASSADGNFWVRIDMSATDGGEGFEALTAMTVTGTVPEPATLITLGALAGLGLWKRK